MAPARILAAVFAVVGVLAVQPAHADAAGVATYRGTLEVFHADDFAGGRARESSWLVGGERRWRLRVGRSGARLAAGSRLVVRGRTRGGVIRGRVVRATPPARRSAVTLGPRKVAVILFNFASDQREPWQPANAGAAVFNRSDSANTFYQEESHGRISLVGKRFDYGDVFGWYTIDASPGSCARPGEWSDAARAEAERAGVDLSGYDYFIYAFPYQASCSSWAGSAFGNEAWLNGTIDPRTVSHELGHVMGLGHASSFECRDAAGAGVPLGPYCQRYEYGEEFDVMGGLQHRHHHGWHLRQLGLLSDANVRTVTASGTYTLRSAFAPSSDATLLRIPRARGAAGEVLSSYYLDFRTAGGVFENFAASEPIANGISIRLLSEVTRSYLDNSYLLDTTPDWRPAGRLSDAALTVGRSYDDGAIRITTTAISGDTATVSIQLTPDTQAPTQPTGLRFTPEDAYGFAGSLAWEPSTDNVLVERYAVLRDGVEVESFDRDDYTYDTAWTQTHDGLHPAERVIGIPRDDRDTPLQVIAYDPAGNPSPASEPLTLRRRTAPPPTRTPTPPPTAQPQPPRMLITHRRHGRRAIRIQLNVEGNHPAVARVTLRIDGRTRRTSRGNYTTYTWNTRRVRKGRHTITATGHDHSGLPIATATARVRIR